MAVERKRSGTAISLFHATQNAIEDRLVGRVITIVEVVPSQELSDVLDRIEFERKRRGVNAPFQRYAELSTGTRVLVFQFYGSSDCRPFCFVCPETMRFRTSVSHANGSTSLSFAV
jgi:hypothetical protein